MDGSVDNGGGGLLCQFDAMVHDIFTAASRSLLLSDFLHLSRGEFRGELQVRITPNIFQLVITVIVKRGDDHKELTCPTKQ
jgi:hypothetical protein